MSRDPIQVAFPPFYGFTKRVVITVAAAAVVLWVLNLTLPGMAYLFADQSVLHMEFAFKRPWEFITYPFQTMGMTLLSLLLACLMLWMFGSPLEDARGTRWMYEFFFASTIGGGVLTVVLARTLLRGSFEFGVDAGVSGPWSVIAAMLVAFAVMFPNMTMRLYFVIPVKAKWVAAGTLVLYFAGVLVGGNRANALLALCNVLCGYLFLRYSPRYGVRIAGSEFVYGLRNRWAKQKRRRAAKKFKVYMREQGKDVSLDDAGRYVSVDDEKRDINDRRWMN